MYPTFLKITIENEIIWAQMWESSSNARITFLSNPMTSATDQWPNDKILILLQVIWILRQENSIWTLLQTFKTP